MIYSDEDFLDEKISNYNPQFKTSYNPYLLLTHNYIGEFCFIKSNSIDFKLPFLCNSKLTIWNVILMLYPIFNTDNVKSIPKILYRKISDHSEKEKLDIFMECKILNEFNEKNNQLFNMKTIENIKKFKIQFNNNSNPSISIVIPTRDMVDFLKTTVDSILKLTNYSNYEIIIVDNNSKNNETLEYFDSFKSNPIVKIFKDDRPFNFSQLNNSAVFKISSEIVVFLNNDTKLITEYWLDEISSLCLQENIGAVGGKLYYEDLTIQHSGVVLGFRNSVEHYHKHLSNANNGYLDRLNLLQCTSALTGAFLAIERKKFLEVSGFD